MSGDAQWLPACQIHVAVDISLLWQGRIFSVREKNIPMRLAEAEGFSCERFGMANESLQRSQRPSVQVVAGKSLRSAKKTITSCAELFFVFEMFRFPRACCDRCARVQQS